MNAKMTLSLLAAVLTLPLAGLSQQASTDDPDIVAFDKTVAALPSVAKDIDLTLDVIGFDIRKGSTEEKQLADTAAAGAGRYFPVAKAQDLASIFTQVTTGVAMGGGGGMVLPKAGGPSGLLIGLAVLGLGALALVVGIVALQRRRAVEGPGRVRPARPRGGAKVSARLDVFYPDGGTKSVRVTDVRTTIGRRADCAVHLSDPVASGLHAELVASGDGFVIRDLGSSNGTFVNGQPVTESPLYVGDEVVVGTTKIVLGE
jgi:hypothetical protein